MNRNPLMIHRLAGLALSGVFGGYHPYAMDDGRVPEKPTRRARDIVHIVTEKPKGKRARRRARGKSGSAQ